MEQVSVRCFSYREFIVLAYENTGDIPTSSKHASNMQQMHEELYRYEIAAGRPLLRPTTENGIRILNGCCRKMAPQELNGTFTSGVGDAEMESS